MRVELAARMGARLTLMLLAVGAGGCELFPADLHRQDGGVAADRSERPRVPLAETCAGQLTIIDQAVVNAPVDLSTLADDGPRCSGTELTGGDGYFGIAMGAGEQWHVHLSARTRLGFDPALYVMASCDDECEPGWAVDDCRSDQDEHLTVVAPEDGVYVVGIDGHGTGGGVYDLLVSHPVCGNGGGPEHGETCDDGNLLASDGCDQRCRAELDPGEAEKEPNDDRWGANVVTPGSVVGGHAGGRCDVDYFLVEHPGGPLELEVRAEVCAPLVLQLEDERGTVHGVGEPGTSEVCARLTASLTADTYLVRVAADPEGEYLPYELAIGP